MNMSRTTIVCQHCNTPNRGDALFCSSYDKPLSAQKTNQPQPVEIFLSYSHADENLKQQFLKHMAILGRGRADKAIIWHDRDIQAGADWQRQIDSHLATANIIILFISADFIASDYCYSNEMEAAMKRHQKGEAKVIPIIVRPVEWEDTPFYQLQALPRNFQPVVTWSNRDEAWFDIVKEIKKLI